MTQQYSDAITDLRPGSLNLAFTRVFIQLVIKYNLPVYNLTNDSSCQDIKKEGLPDCRSHPSKNKTRKTAMLYLRKFIH